MNHLQQYLQHYTPCQAQEQLFVSILQEGLLLQKRLTDLQQKGDSRPLRRLIFQQKRWRSQLISQIFFRLPALSRPRHRILKQCREEYDSLCNEIAAEFANRILKEFKPDLCQQGKTLTEKLTIWVNSKLRLKWRILDLITPQKKTHDIRLLELIYELVRRSPEGFTKLDFLTALQQQAPKLNPVTATEFLLELLPRCWSAPPAGDRYFLDETLLQNYINHLSEAIYITSLDQETVENIPDDQNLAQLSPKISYAQKITQLLQQYRTTLQGICLKENPHCHCFLLLENYFQENLAGQTINETEIVQQLGVKRPTYQAHLERKCLPAFWEFFIYNSPVSQTDPQTQHNQLKTYIETDPKLLLKKCYYADQQQQSYPDCNCQNLSQKILTIFTLKPEKWKNLAALYQLSVDTLSRFWKMKCLFLLSWVVFELETEYIDPIDLDN